MTTQDQLILLIEEAEAIAGGLRPLARLLEMNPSNLIAMKKGERPCNWRTRGAMRVVLGEEPTHAFMAAMAEDLAQSENPDEKKAADGFETMMAAFPDAWRKRRITPLFQTAMTRVLGTVYGTLHNGFRHLEKLAKSQHGVVTSSVQPDNLSFSL